MLNKLLRVGGAFLVAVLAASIVSSVFSSQFVVAGLNGVGVDVPFNIRIAMTFSDFSILQTLLMVVAACLLIGFLIAALGFKLLGGNRQLWYVAAGGCALLTTLLLMESLLQLMPVAGARTTFGLITQAIAGMLGGYVYAVVSKPKSDQES